MDAYSLNDAAEVPSVAVALRHDRALGSAMEEALDTVGITDAYLGRKLKEGLEATRVGFDAKGGEFIESTLPDFNIQHKYLVTLLELRGLNKKSKEAPLKKEDDEEQDRSHNSEGEIIVLNTLKDKFKKKSSDKK